MSEQPSVAGEMGQVVAAGFFTYEGMREQRDQAVAYIARLEAELEQVRGRAQVAETELEAANAEIAAMKRPQLTDENRAAELLGLAQQLDRTVRRLAPMFDTNAGGVDAAAGGAFDLLSERTLPRLLLLAAEVQS